jgi:TonB family protein
MMNPDPHKEKCSVAKISRYSMAIVIMIALPFSAASAESMQERPQAYAYVSADYIITAEIAGPRSFILNFINLSDYVIVVQPSEFIYRVSSGRFYIGQVFEGEHKDGRGMTFKYRASILLGSRTFTGLTIVGRFLEQDSIEEMSVRIGSKRFYLDSLDRFQFELLAGQIAELDIEKSDSRQAIAEANISTRGRIARTDGTSAWNKDWQGLISIDGVNPPKIIQSPPVTPTEEAIKTDTYGKVQLSATINKNGGIQDLMVVRGLGRGLDDRALAAVKNSWVFLPATKNGEVVQTSIKFDVSFLPPQKP